MSNGEYICAWETHGGTPPDPQLSSPVEDTLWCGKPLRRQMDDTEDDWSYVPEEVTCKACRDVILRRTTPQSIPDPGWLNN